MNRPFLRTLLLLAGFAGLSIPTKAADDQVVVKIPFEFVAAGKAFPAGDYRISRLRDGEPRILVLSSIERRGDAIMLRPVTEDVSRGKAQLRFAAVGDQHFLNRIETGDHAYILEVPSTDSLLASARSKASAASSSSGSN